MVLGRRRGKAFSPRLRMNKLFKLSLLNPPQLVHMNNVFKSQVTSFLSGSLANMKLDKFKFSNYLRIQCPTRIISFKNLDVKVWVQPGYGDRNRRQHEDRRLGHNLTNPVLSLVPADTDNNRKWSIRERSDIKVISWKNSTATGIIKYHPREGLKDLNEWLIQRRHTSHCETCVCV